MKNTKMLKKNYEFRFVLTRGKYYSCKYIYAFCVSNNSNENRIGIAIGTKTGKAVKRNYLKRIIKESYRLNEKKASIGNSIVFSIKNKTNIAELSFRLVEKDIIEILNKIGQT